MLQEPIDRFNEAMLRAANQLAIALTQAAKSVQSDRYDE
jgi:hypothetical protein